MSASATQGGHKYALYLSTYCALHFYLEQLYSKNNKFRTFARVFKQLAAHHGRP